MTHAFSAWKEGAKIYIPLALIGGVLAGYFYPGPAAWLAVPFILLALFSAYFFRDPKRSITANGNELVAPADGRIVGIDELDGTPYYDGQCRRVSIFLSILDVHVNRSPGSGSVKRVVYKPGGFKNAMRPETTETNESNAVWLDTARGPITVRQISGAIARRIICQCGEGDKLEAGQKFGMIRFGSRTELYIPLNAEVCVPLNAKVRAGSTIIARYT